MSKAEEKLISALQIIERPVEVRQRFEAVITKPDIVERICDHVANGGSLVHLCRMWAISYGKMMRWLKTQPGAEAMYQDALAAREEWAQEVVLADLHNYAQADIRDVFDENGHVVNPKNLEDHIAPAVQSITVKTRQIKGFKDEPDEIETTFEVKLVDKLKVADMLNRRQGKYVDKVDHTGSVKLVDLIVGSYKKNEGPK